MNDNETTTQPTMADRIKEYGITMKAQRIVARPDGHNKDWHKDASHFVVTLTCEGRTLSTCYSMGSAHLDRYVLEKSEKKYTGFTRQEVKKAFSGGRSIHDERVRDSVRKILGRDFAPDIASVFDSLVLDASCYENARNFEEFCAEFGYDTDSRKAEAMYNACGQNAKDLARLLGSRKAFEDVLSNTESL